MQDASKMTVDQITEGSILSVRCKSDRILGRELLSNLQIQFDKVAVMKSRLKYLAGTYNGFRLVANDGNAYYRAVYVALFEKLLVSENRSVFGILHGKLSSLLEILKDNETNDETSKNNVFYVEYIVNLLSLAEGI
jgi:hypothetical protein